MISITDEARDAVLDALRSEDRDPASAYLRVGVKGGGCSGLSYTLTFTDQLEEGDEV